MKQLDERDWRRQALRIYELGITTQHERGIAYAWHASSRNGGSTSLREQSQPHCILKLLNVTPLTLLAQLHGVAYRFNLTPVTPA